MAAMEAGEHGAAQPVRGLAVSEDGLTLELAITTMPQGEERELRFRIVEADGETVRDFDVEQHEAHAPDRRAPRPQRLPAPAPDPAARRHLVGAAAPACRRHLPRLRRLLARRRGAHAWPTDLQVDGAVRSRPLPARRDRARRSTACAIRLDSAARHGGEEDELCLHRQPRRPPGRRPGLPRRQGPPGRPARGRPRLPARPPRAADRLALRGDLPERRPLPPVPPVPASAARSIPPPSPARWGDERCRNRAGRAADRGHDLRLLREPGRAHASTSSTASAPRSTTRPRRRRVDYDAAHVAPTQLVEAVARRRLHGVAAAERRRRRPGGAGGRGPRPRRCASAC